MIRFLMLSRNDDGIGSVGIFRGDFRGLELPELVPLVLWSWAKSKLDIVWDGKD